MSPTNFPNDVNIQGDLAVQGVLTPSAYSPIARASLVAETGYFSIPLHAFRTWDSFERPLRAIGVADRFVNLVFSPTTADNSYFVADRPYRIIGIVSRLEVTGTDGGAVTASVKKAPSATDIAAGTKVNLTDLNAKSTVDTNQDLGISATSTALDIPAGTCIGLDWTGTTTAAAGVVTVALVDESLDSSTDDLFIATPAFATGCPYLSSGDLNALGAITRYARAMIMLPPEYVATSVASVRVAGSMITSPASVVATVDIEAYINNRNALITGTDLCATAAQSINSTTFAEKSFTLTPTNLAPGTTIDLRLTLAANSATASSHFAAIAAVDLVLNIKG